MIPGFTIEHEQCPRQLMRHAQRRRARIVDNNQIQVPSLGLLRCVSAQEHRKHALKYCAEILADHY